MADTALERTIAQDSRRQPTQDKLEFVRDQIRYMRDLEKRIQDCQEILKGLNTEKEELQFSILPTLFMENRISAISLDAEGNLPAYDAKLVDYYKANIKTDWPAEKKNAAFAWLKKRRLSDLIKTIFTIEVGLGNSKLTKKIEEILRLEKIPHTKQKAVPWNTLTSAIKEMYHSNQTLTNEEIELLGAKIGKIVTLKPNKEA